MAESRQTVGVKFGWWPIREHKATAFESVSSAVKILSLKTSLFLAIQIYHKIQRAKGPSTMPVGGKFFLLIRLFHILLKAIDSLYSMLGKTGADVQTCFAKEQ